VFVRQAIHEGLEFYPRKKWVGQNLVTVENTYRDIFID